jgi:hypothetical protein
MSEPWKTCSTCKKPIPHGARYFRCSVSTCNSGRFQLVFCSVSCWDAHNPSMNHRSGTWAIEEFAPKAPAGGLAAHAEPERRVVRPGGLAAKEPEEVLIIASRLKDFVRDEAQFNTSADVMEALSEIVRDHTRDAITRARAEGRKTLMGRDFRR